MSEVTPVSADGNTPALPNAADIADWAHELGFDFVGIAARPSSVDVDGLQQWLSAQCHGEMHYMDEHAGLRARPEALVPGTASIVMVGMNYTPRDANWLEVEHHRLVDSTQAVVSMYARGRDYHKRVRRQLQKLADRVSAAVGPFGYRAFCDSAPVMEVSLARQAGLGWRGKHTLLLNRSGGSMFFLGALFTSLPLAPTAPVDAHCGSCQRCIDICPTQAIVAPYRLDARRCISYLTIELPGRIEPALRPLIGNRVYGCDDCQLVCPWNKFAQPSASEDFSPRHGLDSATLLELFAWTEGQFEQNTRGSAIRRIGYQRWLRNLAVAIGNMTEDADVAQRRQALAMMRARRHDASEMVAEHIDWAVQRLLQLDGVT